MYIHFAGILNGIEYQILKTKEGWYSDRPLRYSLPRKAMATTSA